MWDSVPWFTGGGAQHSPEVARLLAYAATNGAEGIVTPGDLKVVPLDVPGSSIRVLAGACVINADAAGGANQSYVGRNVDQDVVGIQATGSGSGRSDLVVARIEDPFMAGEPWNDPADAKVGPYIFTRVIPNVSPTVTSAPAGSSAIALARIDIPANTGTITAGMVKDLRQLAQPRVSARNYGGPATGNVSYPSGTKETGDPFNMTPISTIRPMVDVPSWATHVDITAQAVSLLSPTQQSSGAALVRLGSIYGPHLNYDFSEAGAVGPNNLATLAAATIGTTVPTAMRGTAQQLSLRARIDVGTLQTQPWSVVLFNVSFYERAV